MRSLTGSIKRLGIAAIALTSLAGVTVSGVAQSEVDCPLPPLTLPLFAATPPAEVASTPVPVTDAPSLDEAGAQEAMTVIVSCSNSGDVAVAYSIFTDRYLASLLDDPDEVYLPAFEQQVDQGAVQPERTLELTEIVSVTPLPDGRVEVVAVTSTNGMDYTDTFVLAWFDGAWLIDDVTSLDPAP